MLGGGSRKDVRGRTTPYLKGKQDNLKNLTQKREEKFPVHGKRGKKREGGAKELRTAGKGGGHPHKKEMEC